MTQPDGWSMTKAEFYRSLMEPERFDVGAMLYASVASLRKDGSPFSVPLGFWYDGDHIYLTVGTGRTVGMRMRRDPRVSICINTWSYPPKFITITGLAEEIEDPGHEISYKISHRYPKGHADVDEEQFDRDWVALGRVVFRVKILTVAGSPLYKEHDRTASQGAVLAHEEEKLRKLKEGQ